MNKLFNNIKIAKYLKTETGFEKIGYDEYKVTYLKSQKAHIFRVVINGRIMDQTINILSVRSCYKDTILTAIGDYINGNYKNKDDCLTKKGVSLEYIRQIYSEKVVKNLLTTLVSIQKQDSRDELTKFKIIQDVLQEN